MGSKWDGVATNRSGHKRNGGGLSQLFTAHATTTLNAPSYQQQAEQSALSQKTILETLAPNKNFTVQASAITSVNMNATNSVAAAQDIKGQTQAVMMQTQAVKADISTTIEQAQRDVLAVMKQINAPAIFMNTTSDGTVGDLALSGLGGGSGSFGIIADLIASVSQSSTSAADKKQIIAQIKEALTNKTSTTPTTGGATAQATDENELDWNQFFAEGGDLEALMTTDPNNPPEHLYPEYAELNRIEHGMKEEYTHALVAEQAVEKDPTRDMKAAQQDVNLALRSIQNCNIGYINSLDTQTLEILEEQKTQTWASTPTPAHQTTIGLTA